MPRTVSSPTLAQAGAGVSQPCYLVEIDWNAAASYLCTHSTVNWNGQSWQGEGLVVGFDAGGRPARIRIRDPLAAYRTLILSEGISDKRVRVWKAYVGALAADDPVALFDGYADGAKVAKGEVAFDLDYAMTARQFSPRERIGPRIGVNFVAPPGTRISWAGQVLVLEARQ